MKTKSNINGQNENINIHFLGSKVYCGVSEDQEE